MKELTRNQIVVSGTDAVSLTLALYSGQHYGSQRFSYIRKGSLNSKILRVLKVSQEFSKFLN